MIDVCRTCQILWFDHTEFVDLPKVERKEPAKKGAVTTREERAFAAFKSDQFRRRSFFMKLLDGTVAKELGLENFFSEDFDK